MTTSYWALTMCQDSETLGWEPPPSLSPSYAALPRAALSSISDLKPDDLLSTYFLSGTVLSGGDTPSQGPSSGSSQGSGMRRK